MGMKINERWLEMLKTYIEKGLYQDACTHVESFLVLSDNYNYEIYNIPYSMDILEWECYYSYLKRRYYD